MAKTKKAKKAKEQGSPPAGFFRGTLHALATCLAALLIVYVALLLFSRTDGFRSLLANKVESDWGIPLEIGASRANWCGEITLEDVESVPGDEDPAAAFRADEITLHANPFLLLWKGPRAAICYVASRGWEFTFRQDRDGAWLPLDLQSANRWFNQWLALRLDLDEETGTVRPAPREVELNLESGSLAWRDAEGSQLARAGNVTLLMTPLDLPERAASHVRLQVANVSEMGRIRVSDIDAEIIRADDRDLVLAYESAEESRGRARYEPRGGRERRALEPPPASVTPVPLPSIETEPLQTPAAPRDVMRTERFEPRQEVEEQIRSELQDALSD